MAWEWVAPVGTSVVGVAGILATYLTAQKGRDHAEAVADRKNSHDFALAREQRQQQRQAEAYIEVLALVFAFNDHLKKANLETGALSEGAKAPEILPNARSKALVAAYGSSRAMQLYGEWVVAIRAAHASRTRLREARSSDESAEGEELSATRNEFASGIEAARDAADRLSEQIASELNSHGRPIG